MNIFCSVNILNYLAKRPRIRSKDPGQTTLLGLLCLLPVVDKHFVNLKNLIIKCFDENS